MRQQYMLFCESHGWHFQWIFWWIGLREAGRGRKQNIAVGLGFTFTKCPMCL